MQICLLHRTPRRRYVDVIRVHKHSALSLPLGRTHFSAHLKVGVAMCLAGSSQVTCSFKNLYYEWDMNFCCLSHQDLLTIFPFALWGKTYIKYNHLKRTCLDTYLYIYTYEYTSLTMMRSRRRISSTSERALMFLPHQYNHHSHLTNQHFGFYHHRSDLPDLGTLYK